MNYCTKCDSYYAKPGTCNCFAHSQITLVPPTTAPTITAPTITPWAPAQTYPWSPPISPTVIYGAATHMTTPDGSGVVRVNLSGGGVC